MAFVASLYPDALLGQERGRLFDAEVHTDYVLVDPGRMANAVWWSLDGVSSGLFDQGAVMREVSVPQLVTIESDELFLVDGESGTRVLVYSLSDLALERALGGDGDGPGQFRVRPGHRVGLDVTPERILVTGGSKIALFDRGGRLLSEVPFPFWTQWDFKSFGDGFVGEGSDPSDYSYLLNLYDSELRATKELLRVPNPVGAEGGPIHVLTTSLQYQVAGDEVFAWGHTPELVVEVFDSAGEKLRTLSPPYDRIPVTEQIRAMILESYTANPGFADQTDELRERIVFPSHFPAIWDGYVDDGLLYLLTYERQGWQFKMLRFDAHGNALGSTLVPVRLSPANTPYPATVYRGTWYQIARNHETGEWDLLAHELQF
jgi:hypothetical protein